MNLVVLMMLFLAVCPPEGDNPETKIQQLDRLKNRTMMGISITDVSLDDILAPGDDRNRWSDHTYARITAWVVHVKDGGPESCNCHAKDEMHKDTHIEIARVKGEKDKSKHMIVEITPAFKALHPDWTTKKLSKALLGKRVTFTGWMMFDEMHIMQSYNTNPKGKEIFRATCEEIHPVTEIEILQ